MQLKEEEAKRKKKQEEEEELQRMKDIQRKKVTITAAYRNDV